MPLELAELLQPIADDEPGGPYLRYDPVYDQIRIARTEEEELPSGEWERERKTADPAQVIRLSHELLGTRSKDLQIAAWLAEALLKRDGFGGLADGLDLIRGLLEEFWEHLHPELEDDGDAEMRAAPLVWLGGYLDRAVRMMPVVAGRFDMAAYRDSRQVGYEEDAVTYEARDIRKAAIEAGRVTAEEFDAAFGETPKAWYRALVNDLDRSLTALAELERVSDERFGVDAPGYAGLARAIAEVKQVAVELLQRKLEREPDPVEPEPLLEADPARPVEVEIAAPAAGGGGGAAVANPAAMVGAEGGAEGAIAAAARQLRRADPGNPGPYLMLRGLRWGELRAGGGAVDAALLTAPPTELRTRLKQLLMDERWEELLETGEEVMASRYGRGWLDMQRYAVTAADALAGDYLTVGQAIRGALRELLRDLPELPSITLMDDTPTANSETRAWLRAEGMLAEPSNAAAVDETPPPPRRPRSDPLLRARELASAGRSADAVDLLMRDAEEERSRRGRFLRRMEAAAILVDAGKPLVALPILEDLAEIIDEHGLERWEEAETVARALGLLYQCNVAIDGDGSSVHHLFVRVCRLDPLQALSFGSGAAQE